MRSCGQQFPGRRTNMSVTLFLPSMAPDEASPEDPHLPTPSSYNPGDTVMSMKLPLKETRSKTAQQVRTRLPVRCSTNKFLIIESRVNMSSRARLSWASLDRPRVQTEKPCVQHLPASTGQSRSRYFHVRGRSVRHYPSRSLSAVVRKPLTLLRTWSSILLLARRPRRPWASVGR